MTTKSVISHIWMIATLASASALMGGCSSDEPLGIECDLLTITLHDQGEQKIFCDALITNATYDNNSRQWILEKDSTSSLCNLAHLVTYDNEKGTCESDPLDRATSSVEFYILKGHQVGSYRVDFTISDGATALLVGTNGEETVFNSGDIVDFGASGGSIKIRVRSEGQYKNSIDNQRYTNTREYQISVSVKNEQFSEEQTIVALYDFNGNYSAMPFFFHCMYVCM